MQRTSRSLITLVAALLILLIVPMAVGAHGLETPRPTIVVAQSWLGAAVDSFLDILSRHGLGSRHHSPGAPAGIQAKSSTPAGGSCIDPQGGRYPPPCHK